ncbi:hypothetical protein [Pseudobacter ginsenosidimutans]|nr:hypothetical protein [Pseudobacter ginsenosidimutans]QEC43122.1 hypothetical protein FSB84_16005 [Pseudobacter ginsenosidimutans]
MKKIALFTFCLMLLSIVGFTQSSTADSLAVLKKEKEMLKMQERISQYKIDSVTLELDLQEKKNELHKLKLESQSLADKNYQHAQNLQRDAHSKTATRKADKAASAARKAAKKVRKAESSVDKTEKKLKKLKKNLDKEENKLKKLTVLEK